MVGFFARLLRVIPFLDILRNLKKHEHIKNKNNKSKIVTYDNVEMYF